MKISSLEIDKGCGNIQPGVIAVANENRFDASFMSEPLTAYAVGYPDDNGIQALLDSLFPGVKVPRKFEYRTASASEAFVSELDDLRAIGDKGFARKKYSGGTETTKTYNKGLTAVLDKDEMVEGDEERATGKLINHLRRNDLRRGFALVDSAASNAAKTWNTASDPDMDIMSQKDIGDLARGVPANLVFIGSTAWTKRVLAYRSNDKAGSFASAAMSIEQLAAFLGVDGVKLCKEMFKSGKGQANQRFAAAYAYILYNSQNPDREDASNCKRFYTPTESGDFRVYRQETVKTVEISVEHYSHLVVTSTLGIRKITVS